MATERLQQDALSARDHKRVADYVGRVAGIQLPESKRTLIEGRLRKRQHARGLRSLRDYIDFALDEQAGTEERLHLIDAITTNKTDFYREPAHFRFLREHILGEIAVRRDRGWRKPLRIWSAGCASGEEPYTLAMEMLELQRMHPEFRFEIRATDISASSLAIARTAIYPHQRVASMPLTLRRRYLLRTRDRSLDLVRIAPEVRERVRFASLNLLTDAYDVPDRPDIVLCRNVMIYFSHPDRDRIVARFLRILPPGGLLLIGHSESLSGSGTAFEQIQPAIYRKAES
ncbi:MCP methyltransferase, CheR-type [Thiorhodococcus drewsii AZ1]|uniref:Chemotaxis protein methyltransferase n=1 Tax=Thiorhodococcus drewsii AZ1 TaxID=765913 RepID=G2E7S8_9GAMM|nr:CheR family methyltransferase [Thiorhodococcus drewsii]EGV27839.1 MCP methyltransferase, CheR-type [Thiorhodococcus drewsii AZ1]